MSVFIMTVICRVWEADDWVGDRRGKTLCECKHVAKSAVDLQRVSDSKKKGCVVPSEDLSGC